MQEFPKTLKIIIIWLVIGTFIFLGVLWFESSSKQSKISVEGNSIEIKRARDGHYHWDGAVSGYAVSFLVDTGASITIIPETIANQAELKTIGSAEFNTAAGWVQGKIVVGDLHLEGGVFVSRLRMGVIPGQEDQALLGMDVIGKLHMKQSDGVIQFSK